MKTSLIQSLGKQQIELLKYTNDPVLFMKDILGLKCEKFHQEWLDAFEKNRFVSLLAPRGHGKCVKRGSLVTRADGSFTEIENCKVGDKVLCIDTKDNSIKSSRISSLYNNGIKPVYKIILNSGKETIVTSNHPFYDGEKWVSIDDGLTVGDRIVIPRNIVRPNSYKYFSDAEIITLAVLIAEGNIATTGASTSFSTSDENLVEWLNSDILPQVGAFMINQSLSRDDCNYNILRTAMYDGRTSVFTKWLKKYGLWGKSAHEKEIPKQLFRHPNEDIKLFLKYLWLCDGTININNKDHVDISYNTSSILLSRQIQILLEYVGIPSNVRYHKTKKKDNYQVVVVGDKDIKLKFLDNILEEKNYSVRDSLNEILHHSNVDTIPNEILLKNIKITPWQYRKNYNIRIDNKYSITRNKLRKLILIENENNNLIKLNSDNIRWDWIKSIEYVGEDQTYGLEIERYHNHIIDGIISHNTTAIGSYILWRIVRNRNIRILIVTINQDKANSMMTFVQEHLSKNQKLIELFGDFRGQATWSRDQIRVTLNDTRHTFYNEPTLKVLGITSKIISAHYDLIVLDDITDNNNSKTDHQRKELEDWYDGPLVGTFLSNTKVISIGTKWHESDIHEYLANKSGFKSLRYKALLVDPEKEDKPARVLWPEHLPWDENMIKELNIDRKDKGLPLIPEDALTLKFIREHQGEIHFQMQYQNEVIHSGVTKFKPEWIESAKRKFDNLHGILPSNLKLFIGVDFGGEDKKSDYFAITVVGADSDGDIYILDNYRTHASLHRQIEIIKSMDEKWHPSRIGIETAAQQKIIVDNIIRENPHLPIIPIKSSIVNDRDTRMDRMSLLFETNRVYLNPTFIHLIDELLVYPRGSHDDLIDSLSFAIQTFESLGFIDYSKVKKLISARNTYKFYKI